MTRSTRMLQKKSPIQIMNYLTRTVSWIKKSSGGWEWQAHVMDLSPRNFNYLLENALMLTFPQVPSPYPMCAGVRSLKTVFQGRYPVRIEDFKIPIVFNVRYNALQPCHPRYAMQELAQEYDQLEDTYIVINLLSFNAHDQLEKVIELMLATVDVVRNDAKYEDDATLPLGQETTTSNKGKIRILCLNDLTTLEERPTARTTLSSRVAWLCWLLVQLQDLFPELQDLELVFIHENTPNALKDVLEELIRQELTRQLIEGEFISPLKEWFSETRISSNCRRNLEEIDNWWNRFQSTTSRETLRKQFGIAMSFLRQKNREITEPPISIMENASPTLTDLKAMSVLKLIKQQLFDEPSIHGPELLALACLDPQLKKFIYQWFGQHDLIIGASRCFGKIQSLTTVQHLLRLITLACPEFHEKEPFQEAYSMKLFELRGLP